MPENSWTSFRHTLILHTRTLLSFWSIMRVVGCVSECVANTHILQVFNIWLTLTEWVRECMNYWLIDRLPACRKLNEIISNIDKNTFTTTRRRRRQSFCKNTAASSSLAQLLLNISIIVVISCWNFGNAPIQLNPKHRRSSWTSKHFCLHTFSRLRYHHHRHRH